MNLFSKRHSACHLDIEKALGKPLASITKEEILNLFPSSRFSQSEVWSNMYLELASDPYKKQQTTLQRLNSLWLIPLFALIILPIHWVFTGKWGVERSSKVGVFLGKVIGE